MGRPLLDIDGLTVRFQTPTGPVDAVRGVGFSMGRERLAIVGESGSGKSMVARSLLGLAGRRAQIGAKRAQFDGIDLLGLTNRRWSALRGRRIAMIVQDPRQGLDPIRTVEHQLAEMLRLHRSPMPGSAAAEVIDNMLTQMGIRDPRRVRDLYPGELSGGMAQRVMIAMMLTGGPELLIADEVTSALDALVQRQILELLDEKVRQRGMGMILISHDLDLVADFADRILVMYRGRIVETLRGGLSYLDAEHPYTRGLAACVPSFAHAGRPLPVLNRDAGWTE